MQEITLCLHTYPRKATTIEYSGAVGTLSHQSRAGSSAQRATELPCTCLERLSSPSHLLFELVETPLHTIFVEFKLSNTIATYPVKA